MAEFIELSFFIFVMLYFDTIDVQIYRKHKLLDVWLSYENGWMLEMLGMTFIEMFYVKGHML